MSAIKAVSLFQIKTSAQQVVGVSNWMTFPIYDADFGWGRPFHVSTCDMAYNRFLMVIPGAQGDAHLSLFMMDDKVDAVMATFMQELGST